MNIAISREKLLKLYFGLLQRKQHLILAKSTLCFVGLLIYLSFFSLRNVLIFSRSLRRRRRLALIVGQDFQVQQIYWYV